MQTFIDTARRSGKTFAIRTPAFWPSLLAALVLLLPACYGTTTVAKLKDNSKTSLHFLRLGQPTVRAIEQGNADKEVDMGRVGVDQAGSIRRQDGTLLLSCSQCLDGDVTLLSEQGLTASNDSNVEELLEGKKGRKAGRIKMHYFYGVTDTRNLNPVLEFPRSNVDYFEETRTPSRTWGWVGLGAGLVLTGVGVYMLAEGSVGGGVGMLIPGIGLDAFGVVHLVMSPTLRRFDAEGNAKQAPLPPPPEPEEEEEEKKADEDKWKPATKEEPEEKSFFEGEPEPKPEPEAEPEPEPEPEPKKAPAKKKKPAKTKPEKKGGDGFDDFLL